MTDNKDALSALVILGNDLASSGQFPPERQGLYRKIYSFLSCKGATTSPSAGVDVSKILGHVEAALRLQNAMINNRISDDLAVQAKIELGSAIKALQTLPDAQGWQPIDDWHEDIGDAFWTKFPVTEPYYAGSPLDVKWPHYHTHFIPMSIFNHLLDERGMPIPAPPKPTKE